MRKKFTIPERPIRYTTHIRTHPAFSHTHSMASSSEQTLTGTWKSTLYDTTFSPNGNLAEVCGSILFSLDDRSVKKGGGSWLADGKVTMLYHSGYRMGESKTFPVSVYAEIQPHRLGHIDDESFLCVRAHRPRLDNMENLRQHFVQGATVSGSQHVSALLPNIASGRTLCHAGSGRRWFGDDGTQINYFLIFFAAHNEKNQRVSD